MVGKVIVVRGWKADILHRRPSLFWGADGEKDFFFTHSFSWKRRKDAPVLFLQERRDGER
jgi:hypothetical protein